MFEDEYKAMFEEDHEEEKNTPCPPELQKTKILKYDGAECKVFYNYVPPYTYGVTPINCWWGRVDDYKGWTWTCPLEDSVENIEQACEIIEPLFKKVVDRKNRRIAEALQDSHG